MDPTVLFAAPHPDLPGGVNAAVSALLTALPGAQRLTVGRRPWRIGSTALDPLRIRAARADVLVLNTSLRAKALTRDLVLLAAWGRPAALWIHGGTANTWATLPRALAHTLAERALLVVLHERFRDRLLALDVPNDRIAVIPPTYDPTAIPPRERPGSDVLFLGRLTREKGARELLEAFALVAEKIPTARLVLAGQGPLKPTLRGRIARLGLRSRVDLPGQLGPSRKWLALSEAAVLAQPSLDEAVPVAILEALAAGLPVVGTDVGAVASTIGPAGRVVPPGDIPAFAEALRDVYLAPEAFAQHALERARPYHPEQVAALWRDALRRAVA